MIFLNNAIKLAILCLIASWCISFLLAHFLARIMHKHSRFAHIVCVEIFDLEVVYRDRRFEDLVLDFFNDHILAAL